MKSRKTGLSHQLQPGAVRVRHLPRRIRGAPATGSARTTWSPTSAPSSASTRACRSTPAASASSPAITARRRATARLPFVAVGLLYRQGYFLQTIDGEGSQHATYHDSDFATCRSQPAQDERGNEVHVDGRSSGSRRQGEGLAGARRARAAVPARHRPAGEQRADRAIAHRLYGGDRNTRIEQEIVLGIGGVRALEAMGSTPTVWHINEGHAAFLVLERVRTLMKAGTDFAAALEAVAASTVFTTHTAVPAGHDHFANETVDALLRRLLSRAGIDPTTLHGARPHARSRRLQHDRARHPRLALPERRDRASTAASAKRCCATSGRRSSPRKIRSTT